VKKVHEGGDFLAKYKCFIAELKVKLSPPFIFDRSEQKCVFCFKSVTRWTIKIAVVLSSNVCLFFWKISFSTFRWKGKNIRRPLLTSEEIYLHFKIIKKATTCLYRSVQFLVRRTEQTNFDLSDRI
jgi:hypothetical protein